MIQFAFIIVVYYCQRQFANAFMLRDLLTSAAKGEKISVREESILARFFFFGTIDRIVTREW